MYIIYSTIIFIVSMAMHDHKTFILYMFIIDQCKLLLYYGEFWCKSVLNKLIQLSLKMILLIEIQP